MKEGYLQLKIGELVDKCRKIEQKLSLEESTLRRLQQKIGDYKYILNKIKDLNEFKDQVHNQLITENKNLIKKHLDDLSKNISDIVETNIEEKATQINIILKSLREEEIARKDAGKTMIEQTKDITFLKEHNSFLMMKLVNKGVLFYQEVEEMQRRAEKKAREEIQ